MPGLGIGVSALFAPASTYALGEALCAYFNHYRHGDVPFKPYVDRPFTPGGVQILRERYADTGEIGLMRRAIEATIEGQKAAAAALRPGVAEGAVDGVVYAAFRSAGAEGIGFPSIVGSGFNATTLHYDQNTDVCRDGDLVVVDIGARYGYYCGDITRTYPANGSFTPRQRELYNVVLEAQAGGAKILLKQVHDPQRFGVARVRRKLQYLGVNLDGAR